ncbi:MAG: prohibitin family protein [Microcoleaceae cyanobacterium]
MNVKEVFQDQKKTQIFFIVAGLAVAGAIGASILSSGFKVVPVGEVGLVENRGQLSPEPLESGVHWIGPGSEMITFSTRLKDIKETVDVTSKEGLGLNLDVSLQYRVDPAKVGEIYQNIGTDEQEIVVSRFRSIIRQVTATYEVKDIYGEKRQEVAQRSRQALEEKLAPLGFIVEEALLRNVVLPEQIQKAVAAKLVAAQESEQQKFINQKERQELEFKLERARKEAERQKIEARGTSDAQKILSESLTDKVLNMKSIEATQALATSDNTKVIVLGGGDQQLPWILQGQ